MGNFSRYQGIDLLFNAFKIVQGKIHKAKLVIVGGYDDELISVKEKARLSGLTGNVIFTGRKTPQESANLIQLADVLISPRIEGTNTPMKIYSYMASGVPIVATNLSTHTQVLDEHSAVLVEPDPLNMAQGIIEILNDMDRGKNISKNAMEIIEKRYSRKCYLEKLANAYNWIEKQIK